MVPPPLRAALRSACDALAPARRALGVLGPALRRLRPPRQLRPTRAGWIFFFLVFAVGFAALNTGNNLLYLVLSLMLAFLVLSGVLSEVALRGIDVQRRLPRELIAGSPARVVLEIANAQRRAWAHAIALEDVGAGRSARSAPVLGRALALRIAPGGCERRSYALEPPRRGPLAFRGVRVTTRFPFGLFAKSLWLDRPAEVLVYPRLVDRPPPRARAAARRSGRSQLGAPVDRTEVSGLRSFARGDSARRVHWPASWRRGSVLVRDAEGEATGEAVVELRTRGAAAGEHFEQAVEAAASEAEAGLRAGLRVGLRTDATRLPPGSGAAHRARLLGYLALIEPEAEGP